VGDHLRLRDAGAAGGHDGERFGPHALERGLRRVAPEDERPARAVGAESIERPGLAARAARELAQILDCHLFAERVLQDRGELLGEHDRHVRHSATACSIRQRS
jgi:hypothetical protein